MGGGGAIVRSVTTTNDGKVECTRCSRGTRGEPNRGPWYVCPPCRREDTCHHDCYPARDCCICYAERLDRGW